MAQSFEQKIQMVIGDYLLENGFTKLADKLYFYKKEHGVHTNFFVEEIVDDKPTDEQQQFEISFGFNADYANKVMSPYVVEYPEGYGNFAFARISDHNAFLPAILEFSSVTNLVDLKNKILAVVEPVVMASKNFKTNDDAIDFIIDTKMYGRLDAYCVRTKDRVRYERWYRNNNADEIKNGNITEEQIKMKAASEIRSTREKQMVNFAPAFKFPEAWGKCCDWVDEMHYTDWMGAGFEHFNSGKETLKHFVTEEGIQDRFAVFGHSADDSLFAVWQQDNGALPVIYLGEGGVARVITSSIEDFIDLLVINYRDVEHADISTEPVYDNDEIKEQFNNRAFQTVYKNVFGKEIASNGAAIKAKAASCDNLFDWLIANSASFKEWVG
jgi:hypothetical protein